jgi:hypothetical protein
VAAASPARRAISNDRTTSTGEGPGKGAGSFAWASFDTEAGPGASPTQVGGICLEPCWKCAPASRPSPYRAGGHPIRRGLLLRHPRRPARPAAAPGLPDPRRGARLGGSGDPPGQIPRQGAAVAGGGQGGGLHDKGSPASDHGLLAGLRAQEAFHPVRGSPRPEQVPVPGHRERAVEVDHPGAGLRPRRATHEHGVPVPVPHRAARGGVHRRERPPGRGLTPGPAPGVPLVDGHPPQQDGHRQRPHCQGRGAGGRSGTSTGGPDARGSRSAWPGRS